MKSLWILTICLVFGLQALATDAHAARKKTQVRVGMNVYKPTLDVLFVVDSSGSMDTHQKNFARATANLEKSLFQAKRSYHLGVINMDPEGSPLAGGQVAGELLGNPKVIAMGAKKGALAANLRVGTAGSSVEAPFDMISLALSPNMLAKENAGFIRPDSSLAIVLLTDAEDQSKVMSHQLLTELETLKGGLENVTMLSWVIPTGVDSRDCLRDASPTDVPTKIEEATRSLKGKIYNICNMDASSLAEFAYNLTYFGIRMQPSSLEIPLRVAPDLSTLVVKYGTQIVDRNAKTGWAYDAAKKSIVFSEKIQWSNQPTNTEVVISYYPAK